MGNLYAEWCRAQNIAPKEFFAFECTGTQGSEHLADLRGLRNSHFIACTVELLTTGVDVPSVRNIVFFKYVQSPIQFHQMIGRGTRLDAETGKLMFRVYDYTNASRLFGGAFSSPPSPLLKSESGISEEGGQARPHPIRVEGFQVQVSDAGTLIVTQRDGRDVLVTLEQYQELIADSILRQEVRSLDSLRQRWIVPEARRLLLERLPDGERGAKLLQTLLQGRDLRRDGHRQFQDRFLPGRSVFLWQMPDVNTSLQIHLAGVWRLLSQDQRKECGFPRAVGTDQPDAILAVHLQRHLGEQRAPGKRFADIRHREHSEKDCVGEQRQQSSGEWLNSIGVTGVLLKYRVPKRPGLEKHAAPLQDAQRALGLVRHRTGERGIDPKRIGILGFSAGGHLSAGASTIYEKRMRIGCGRWGS
jgi:hypothetical protein